MLLIIETHFKLFYTGRPDSGDTATSFIDVSQIAARNAGGRINYDRPYSDLYPPDIHVQTKPGNSIILTKMYTH
jgi:hypothetical protein